MKTVAVDIRPLLERKWGGISWYTYYIVQGIIQKAARGELRVVLFYNQATLLHCYIVTLLKKWKVYPNVSICGYKMPNKILNLSMRFFSFPNIDELLTIKQLSTVIMVLPNLCFIALSSNTPYIAVCHDLSFEIFPEFFTMRQRLWRSLINPRRFYERAHRIIAVSENTKKDLIDLYHIEGSRIDVVYPGINPGAFYPRGENEACAAREKYHLPDSFILSVGTLEPRKNYETLLESFDMLCDSPLLTKEGLGEVYLLIVGAEGWKYDRIYRFLNRMKRKSQVKFLFNVSREDLPAIYSAARMFIYPSFYEGFGFPPLEAAACGTPVIVSHGSSQPEIMGDAALYIDPFNIADLARAMSGLLMEKELCDRLREKGLQRAREFRWGKTFGEIVSVFA